ncbi:uncharacterized protein [Aegilops tauschii subsp. strangulata]|uniref:uncharacterized protein n=1 Tax=Aegilops tauschii subsp. strangulata TaxID=200361 RepID=UPI003CC87661
MAYSSCRSLIYARLVLATPMRAFVHDVSPGLASLVRRFVNFVFVRLRMPGAGNTDASPGLANPARHNKVDKVPEVYDLYAMAHTASFKKVKAFSQSDLDDANNFTNISSHNKLVRYRDEGKVRKGVDFNPSQGPIDPELVMISGGGRSHGSIAIGDGLIRCPSTLPEIKARQSSSAPEIRPRKRPVQLAIKAAIQSERDRTEKLLAEAAERQRELEERTTKMMEEERARNDMQARAMYELLVSVCEKTGQTAPPMPVIAPGTTVSFI